MPKLGPVAIVAEHYFASIRSVADYQERVPIRSYENFRTDYWSAPFPVLDDVTWPGRIRYFARSSGTTTGESKHIPCSDEMVKSNNTAGVEVLLHHLRNCPPQHRQHWPHVPVRRQLRSRRADSRRLCRRAQSTNAGLWSYAVGDLVRLVDLDPPRLLVAGRISQTVSTFGEHVSGEQLEIAVAAAATRVGAAVADFAVTPIIASESRTVGAHRYIIETSSQQAAELATEIDGSLSEQNADYRTKRVDDLAIAHPVVTTVPDGTFAAWMDCRGKAGGQNKVPRVATPPQLAAIEEHAK